MFSLSKYEFFQVFSYAQSRKDLEIKRKEKEKEIQVTQRILDQTRDKKKKSFNHYIYSINREHIRFIWL